MLLIPREDEEWLVVTEGSCQSSWDGISKWLVRGRQADWPQRWPTGCGAGVRARCHVAVRQWPGSLASSVSHVFSLLGHQACSLAL